MKKRTLKLKRDGKKEITQKYFWELNNSKI